MVQAEHPRTPVNETETETARLPGLVGFRGPRSVVA
jgi:hypothetical protein